METGAGVIIFKQNKRGANDYLILRAKWGRHWSIPKGHREKQESLLVTALRETEEETGIGQEDIQIIDGYNTTVEYKMKKPTRKCPDGVKRVRLFLGKVGRQTTVNLSKEHTDYRWVPLVVTSAFLPSEFHAPLQAADRVIRAGC